MYEGGQIGLYGILSMSPISDPYNEDGTLKRSIRMPLDDQFTITRSVVEDLQDEWLSQTRGYSTYNSVYGEVKIPWIEGLKYRINKIKITALVIMFNSSLQYNPQSS